MEGVGKLVCVYECVCMNVCVMCESVVSKQPIGKSLKDEGSLHVHYT